jgi:hypothetical protein
MTPSVDHSIIERQNWLALLCIRFTAQVSVSAFDVIADERDDKIPKSPEDLTQPHPTQGQAPPLTRCTSVNDIGFYLTDSIWVPISQPHGLECLLPHRSGSFHEKDVSRDGRVALLLCCLHR